MLTKFKTLLILFVAITAVSVTSCEKDDDVDYSAAIVGKWDAQSYKISKFGVPLTEDTFAPNEVELEFKSDKSVKLTSVEYGNFNGTYSINANKLTFSGDVTAVYEFKDASISIENNVLVVEGSETIEGQKFDLRLQMKKK